MKAKKGRNNDKLNKNRIETKLQNMDEEGKLERRGWESNLTKELSYRLIY